jgi:uncharacterized RDD family membrane protein YckC
MNVWLILGVDQTTDLTTIKRAYAAKLKLTRPDENPEDFKRLHTAYKQATRYAKATANNSQPANNSGTLENKTTQPSDEPTSVAPVESECEQLENEEHAATKCEQTAVPQRETSFQSTFTELSPTNHPHESGLKTDIYRQELEEIANADREQEFADFLTEWEALTRRVNALTNHMSTMNYLPAWQFLRESKALGDLQLKTELSNYIFKNIAKRLISKGKKKTLNRDVFNFLNYLFLWSERRDLLEDDFGYEAVEAVMRSLPSNNETSIKLLCTKVHHGDMLAAGYFMRVFATIFDWILLSFAILLQAKLDIAFLEHYDGGGLVSFLLGILLYTVFAPIMEATPLQGTPGKILFGLKVVSKKGRRLNIVHAFFRSLMFTLTLVSFKFTVWINLFLDGHRLLHDRMSGSMVIKR